MTPTYLVIKKTKEDMGINYLAGKTIGFVNHKALKGTLAAHVDGGVPNLLINIPEISPYFFEKACAMSGYLLGVNPFD